MLSGVWGAVTRRSEQSGYRRTAIYQHAERVVQVVANEQAGGMSYDELWAENERLKADHEALWQVWAEVEELSEWGIRVRRDTLWRQTVSAMAWFRFRGRGKSSMLNNTVSKRSGNVRLKKRDAGVVPSAARQSKLCRAVQTL